MSTPIPGPYELPFLGNIADIKDPTVPLWSLHELAETHGEIYQLRFPGQNPCIFVNSVTLTHEVCDETRFRKKVGVLLGNLRRGMRDCVFTCNTDQEEWQIAHRILMPAFGPMSIRAMFDEMHDVAGQLALKWARHGPATPIAVANDFTRLSLDTLALCSMGFRFNSFYQREMHPYIEAMCEFLVEADAMCRRLPLPGFVYRAKDDRFQANIDLMQQIAGEVCKERRAAIHAASRSDSIPVGGAAARKDLLGAMLQGVDPVTGKTLTDDLITDNLVGFLIAGHETTSGMLSFAFYLLLRHPDIYRKARDEVDAVCGRGAITIEHMAQLPYISAVLRETLRLLPTIPGFMVEPLADTTLGARNGKAFAVKRGQTITCVLGPVHKDEAVWGRDADEFKPERMLDEPFNQRLKEHPNCWKPFGNGARACPGRNFAWQESLLICAVLLQNFDFHAQDPDYKLAVTQNITIKPKDYYMHATLRHGLTPTTLEHRLFEPAATSPGPGSSNLKRPETFASKTIADSKLKPVTILYGSESGTCEALAQKLANNAVAHGFSAIKVDALDSLDINTLLSGEYTRAAVHHGQQPPPPVIIVTASYEGKAPANARRFVEAIEALPIATTALTHLNFAVYGCGDRAWATTFHRVPKLIDTTLERLKAHRLTPMGLVDVAGGGVDAVVDFETWEDEMLWPALMEKYSAVENSPHPSLQATAKSTMNSDHDSPAGMAPVAISTTALCSTKAAMVVESRVLTAPGVTPVKRHLEIRLPEGMEYRPGDHMALMPVNTKERVDAVMSRFELDERHSLLVAATSKETMSMSARDLLSRHVELCQTATKRNILTLASSASKPSTKGILSRMASDKSGRVTVLELLEQFPDVSISLASFLVMLLPLRPRLYSISSSSKTHATLTYSVKSATGQHAGVATGYMSSLRPRDTIHVAIRPAHGGFHLPAPGDAHQRPLISIAAGTGIAPFRGFVEERANSGRRDLAPMLLFFGCRSRDEDDLYRSDFDGWRESANAQVYRAYSRQTEHADAAGCRHVQDRFLREWERVKELWELGASVYVCGPRALADAIRESAVKMRMEETGCDDRESAAQWLDTCFNPRLNVDLFD